MDSEWTSAPVPTFSQLKRWYKPGQNVGVRLGEPSRISDLYLYVFDVDIKDAKYKKNAIHALDQLLPDVDWRELPRVKSGSSGPSFHVYFLCAEQFTSKKLARNKEERWEIELFGTGKQVVIPPSVHPETGNRYKWLIEPEFNPKTDEIDPETIRYLVEGEHGSAGQREASTEKTDLTMDEIQDILDEMQDWNDDRETWRDVGMALQHQLGHEEGWPLFDAWSAKNNEKYDRKRNRIDWLSFKSDHKNPITMRSLIREFRNRMILLDFAALDEEDDGKPANNVSGDEIPEHLLKVPGALQDVVDYYNKHAKVDQPEFAVMAALSFGSVMASRNHVTDFGNYASVYFIGVGGSGSGKEFVRTIVAELIRSCGFDRMVGPDTMTSEGSLLGRLMRSPKLIMLTDELGKRLVDDRSSQNANRADVYTAFLSIFSQLDSVWQPVAYSTMSKSKEEAEAINNRKVERPALTLVGLTTPSTFYKALSTGDVASGFMSRFIVVQARPEIQKQRIFKSKRIVPGRLKTWAKEIALRSAESDKDIDLMADQAALVDPFEVEFSSKAVEYLDDIEEQRVKRMRELQQHDLAELFNRTREISMRIAMIVALSDGYDRIQLRHLKWAWDYVSYYADKTVQSFTQNLGRSDLHLLADKLAKTIKSKAEKGMTLSEMNRNFRSFENLSSKDSKEVEELLKRGHGIVQHKIGRQRFAFVAPKFVPLRKEGD